MKNALKWLVVLFFLTCLVATIVSFRNYYDYAETKMLEMEDKILTSELKNRDLTEFNIELMEANKGLSVINEQLEMQIIRTEEKVLEIGELQQELDTKFNSMQIKLETIE